MVEPVGYMVGLKQELEMDNEPYRDMSHNEARDMIALSFREGQRVVRTEHDLPDGKRADVLVIERDGTVTIVEVGRELSASKLERAWDKYGRWSHALFVAIPDLRHDRYAAYAQEPCAFTSSVPVGIIGAYRQGDVVYRQAPRRMMCDDIYLRVIQSLKAT